jgi:ABC-2 type transport system ATP-binding protein
MPPAAVIDVTGLVKSFGPTRAVNGLDMRVKKGEIYGFLGPNGAGKTTFIRMLCGLLRPDSGAGTCLGFDISTEAHKIKPLVGYMTQKFSLYEDMTVRENMEFMARVHRLKAPQKAVEKVIERMKLAPFTDYLAGALSGGWKQRLALATSILHAPKLLLLDEPTAGVDPSARRDFWDHLHGLAAEGVTSLIATHYMDEAERCHRLAYIAGGKLLADGAPAELIAQSDLTTWSVSGPDLHTLSDQLSARSGVSQVVAFGNTLHVSGPDPVALEKAIAPHKTSALNWTKTGTTLEEVFIDLVQRTKGGET